MALCIGHDWTLYLLTISVILGFIVIWPSSWQFHRKMSSNERIWSWLVMEERSKLWDLSRNLQTFCELVKDRGQGQHYLHFRRQPELGDDELLLTLEILNHKTRDGQHKASWLKSSSPIVQQSDCWLSDRKTSLGCELWIVWMSEWRGAMSAIFPGDVWVQCSVSWSLSDNCQHYYWCCHRPGPGQSPQHNIKCDMNDRNNMMGNIGRSWSFCVWKNPCSWFSPWP